MTSEDPADHSLSKKRLEGAGETIVDSGLAQALDGMTTPVARPEFRAQLKQRFLSQAQSSPQVSMPSSGGEVSGSAFGAGVWGIREESGGESGESVTGELANTNSGIEMGINSLLDGWQPELSRVSFRETLRGQFLAGKFPEAQAPGDRTGIEGAPQFEMSRALPDDTDEPGLAQPPVSLLGDRRPRVASKRRAASRAPASARFDRRKAWGLASGLIGLAAAALVLIFLWPDTKTQGWQVLPNHSGSIAAFQVDGRDYSSPDDLAAARIVTAGSETLRLEFTDQMVVEVDPGGALDLTGVNGEQDWTLAMAGVAGGYRVATLPAFKEQSRRLFFTTPESSVEVVGTVFGVDRHLNDPDNPDGTCVCCVDGEVEVRARASDNHASTKAGSSAFIKEAGSVSAMGLDAIHAKPLFELAKEFH